MVDAEAVIYLALLLLTCLWTLLTFQRENYAERSFFALLASVFWIFFGAMHIYTSASAGIGFESVGYLFIGLGIIFMPVAIAYAIWNIRDAAQLRQKREESEIP